MLPRIKLFSRAAQGRPRLERWLTSPLIVGRAAGSSAPLCRPLIQVVAHLSEELRELHRDNEFADGLAPNALRPSITCSVIVFESMSCADANTVCKAWPYPLSLENLALTFASARRIWDCLSPSATVIVACRLPSASSPRASRTLATSGDSSRPARPWRHHFADLDGCHLDAQRSVTSSSLTRRS